MGVCVAGLRTAMNMLNSWSKATIRTWWSESHVSLCVSKTSMSIRAVLPWCKWPTTATLRTNSGKAVMLSKNL